MKTQTQKAEVPFDEVTPQDLLARVDLPEAPIHGVVVGQLVAIDEAGTAHVDFAETGEPCLARTTVPLSETDVGRQVTLMFERGQRHAPIIMGLLQPTGARPVTIEIDGKRLVLSAERELVLTCGEASITLSKSGKVLVRGTHLLNHASGVNRIKGGSVRIN